MTVYTKDERAIIFIDSFIGLEYKYKAALLEKAEQPAEITENLTKFSEFIIKTAGESVYNSMRMSLSERYIDSLICKLDSKGIKVVTRYSEKFPKELKETPHCPVILYCKGKISLLTAQNKFSIVGSRKTIPVSLKAAEDLSRALSESGFTVVTGLAEGGDTAAMKGALTSGALISVLAYGFDYVYPEYNRLLLNKIIEKGLVISEHPPEVAPMGFLFPVRNRIIAGLSKGTLLVSGGMKSGTYYTAEYTVEYNRDLFAFPYNIGVMSGSLCNAYIKKGAILTESVLDILGYYGINFEQNKKTAELTQTEEKCLDIIKDGEIHLNEIMKKSGLKIFELLPVLSSLEIKKQIIKSGANLFAAL